MSDIINGLTSPASDITGRIFDGHFVRFAITADGPTFVAQDVCEALELSKYRDALSRVPEWGQGCPLGVDAPGGSGKSGKQAFATLNRHGVYWLAMRSNTEKAVRFQKWLCTEVLDSIDRQGFYAANGVDPRLARVSEGRMLLERARLKRREAGELVQQAAILLTLEDGITVVDALAKAGVNLSPEDLRRAALAATTWARRNRVPAGRDRDGRTTQPETEINKALGLDQTKLPGLESWPMTAIEQSERVRRSEKALAMVSLLARGARESGGVEDADRCKTVGTGIAYLEDDLIEELADLLPLKRVTCTGDRCTN